MKVTVEFSLGLEEGSPQAVEAFDQFSSYCDDFRFADERTGEEYHPVGMKVLAC